MTTTSQLIDELIDQIRLSDNSLSNAFEVFDEVDLQTLANEGQLRPPYVGVMYEGASPASMSGKEGDHQGGKPIPRTAGFVWKQFSVIIAVGYESAASQGGKEQKRKALDLLSAVQQQLLGHMGVNSRPWVFVDEHPIGAIGDGGSEGVIFYGQLWEIKLPVVGNHTN
jgi:hypothetical protein